MIEPGKLVRVSVGDLRLNAELYRSDAAEEFWAALPQSGSVNRWGQEIYAAIPLQLEPTSEDREVVFVGELAYWPPGSALCVFWGPTPASRSPEEVRAASKVIPLGRLRIVPTPDLDACQAGEQITVERAE